MLVCILEKICHNDIPIIFLFVLRHPFEKNKLLLKINELDNQVFFTLSNIFCRSIGSDSASSNILLSKKIGHNGSLMLLLQLEMYLFVMFEKTLDLKNKYLIFQLYY